MTIENITKVIADGAQFENIDYRNFTSEQIDGIIIHLAVLARNTSGEYTYDSAIRVITSLPKELLHAVSARVLSEDNKVQEQRRELGQKRTDVDKIPRFWDHPADLIIKCTK